MSSLRILVVAFSLTATPHHHPHSRLVFGDVTVGEGEEVRLVVAIGGGVTLSPGSKARDAVAIGGSVDLAEGAEVQRDVTAIGGDISVGRGARIGRNATTYGGAIEVEQGGTVAGTISPHQDYDIGESREEESSPAPSPSIAWAVAWGVLKFLTLFAVGALLLLIVPRQIEGVIDSFSRRPWRCALIGLLGSFLVPPIVLTLFVTLVGIPFIPSLLLAVGLAGAMGYAALALFIGRVVPLHVNDYGKLALGALAVSAVSVIPIVGWVAWSFGWLVAFGAVLNSHFGTRRTTPSVGSPPPPPAVAVA